MRSGGPATTATEQDDASAVEHDEPDQDAGMPADLEVVSEDEVEDDVEADDDEPESESDD